MAVDSMLSRKTKLELQLLFGQLGGWCQASGSGTRRNAGTVKAMADAFSNVSFVSVWAPRILRYLGEPVASCMGKKGNPAKLWVLTGQSIECVQKLMGKTLQHAPE